VKYSELLKDPRWQKKRLKILERDKFTCQRCSDDKKTLNVHHLFYLKNLKPWEYDESQLKTLCESCHSFLETMGTDRPLNLLIYKLEALIELNKQKEWDELFWAIHTILLQLDCVLHDLTWPKNMMPSIQGIVKIQNSFQKR